MSDFHDECAICGTMGHDDDPVADFVPEGISPATFDPAARILAHGECGFGAGYVMA